MDLRGKVEREALSAAFELAYGKIGRDRQKGVYDIFKLVEGFLKRGNPDLDLGYIERELLAEDGLVMGYIDRCFDTLSKKVLKTWILNLGYDALYRGVKTLKESQEKYGISIPKLIIFDAEGMSFTEMDRIVSEGMELGIHGFVIREREDLSEMDETINLAGRHSDGLFMTIIRGDIITEDLAVKLKKAENLALVLKSEGSWNKPMKMLRNEGLLFGTYIKYDEENYMNFLSDDFIELEKELGVMFSGYSKDTAGDEGVNAEIQVRTDMGDFIKARIKEIRNLRRRDGLMVADMEGDNQFIGGHISGGRDFLAIKTVEEIEGKSLIEYLRK